MSSFSLTKKKEEEKEQILQNKEKVEKACRKWDRAKSF